MLADECDVCLTVVGILGRHIVRAEEGAVRGEPGGDVEDLAVPIEGALHGVRVAELVNER